MPSSRKRTFEEFAAEYRTAIPLSPMQWDESRKGRWPVGGYTGQKKRGEAYDAAIVEAFKVADMHPDVCRSRYVPGAYPDHILLPEMFQPDPVITWGTTKLSMGVDMVSKTFTHGASMTRITYNAARNIYHRTRKAAVITGMVFIGALQRVDRLKRRAVELVGPRSSIDIVRAASRPPSSRRSTANRRQRSSRPARPLRSFCSFIGGESKQIEDIVLPDASQRRTTDFLNTPGMTNATPEPLSLFQNQEKFVENHPLTTVMTSPEAELSTNNGAPPIRSRKPKRSRKYRTKEQRMCMMAELASREPPLPSVVPPPVVFQLPDGYAAAVLNAQGPETPGTYNGHPDFSMQDASCLSLAEALAPPARPQKRERKVSFFESPNTGGPVKDTFIITPIARRDPESSERKAAKPDPDDSPSPTVGKPGPAEFSSPIDEASNDVLIPLPVSNLTTESLPTPRSTGHQSTTDSQTQGAETIVNQYSSSVQIIEEDFGLLNVSQETKEARAAEAEAKRAAEEAKRAEEEAQRQAKRKAEEARKREEELRRRSRRIPTKPLLAPLSKEWSERLEIALGLPDDAKVNGSGRELLRRDLASALPQPADRKKGLVGYLNDEIINGYIDKAVEYGNTDGNHKELRSSKEIPSHPKLAAFNSFFYSRLSEAGPQVVKRWVKRKGIEGKSLLTLERLFIPICENLHWTLIVVSPLDRTVEYFDSLNSNPRRKIQTILRWLETELGTLFIRDEWKFNHKAQSPQQQNGIDCGVFAATTAKLITLGIDPMAFNPDDTDLQRRRMCAELMNGGFTGEFAPDLQF